MRRVKELFAAKDMTEGTPWKRIVEFAIPMLIGNVAQQFYNTADSIIVGRYIGDNALAAVGSAGPVLHLLFILFMALPLGLVLWYPNTMVRRTGRGSPVPLAYALP